MGLFELSSNWNAISGSWSRMPSDTSARRLAVFLAVKGRRNFAKATKDCDTRDLLQGDEDFFNWLRTRSRSFRSVDRLGRFPRCRRRELAQHEHWHCFPSQQEAFEAGGVWQRQYHLEYGGSSLFVHGSNVEHDFSDADEQEDSIEGLRATRSRSDAPHALGRLTVALIDVYRLIWEDRGKPEYQEPVKFEDDDGQTCDTSALYALTAQAISILPSPVSFGST